MAVSFPSDSSGLIAEDHSRRLQGGSTWEALTPPAKPDELKNAISSNPLLANMDWQEFSIGPLFIQDRVGERGRPVRIIKLKTLDASIPLPPESVGKESQQIEDDPRITRLGKILRKFHLDEIPNLLSVLAGDMKLIGLRPVTPKSFNQLPLDLQLARVRLGPGVIGVSKIGDDPVEAERSYLRDREKRPGSVDLYYALLVLKRLLTGHFGK